MFTENRFSIGCALSITLLCLGGCVAPAVELDSNEHKAQLGADRRQAEQNTGVQEITLSLDEAVARGVEKNLDARVAALEVLVQQRNVTLEKLKALPSLNASTGYVGRSNDGSSSSKSIESGLQSLEPSQSTDRNRLTSALELNWNLLDVALAYSDAKRADDETRVARERHEKVIQNVQRDVYAAYWRAYAYQQTRDRTAQLVGKASVQLANLNQAVSRNLLSADMAGDQASMLNDRVRSLKELDERLNLSEIELKSMLALPLDAKLTLKSPEARGGDYRSLLAERIETQEWEALQMRPEIREEVLQKNLTLREAKREILTTFPGLELFGSANYDTNSFLSDATWLASSAKIVQNLISIFTLPSRLKAAETKQALADARRQALVAAVVAQTNIARQRLHNQDIVFRDSLAAKESVRKKALLLERRKGSGLASGQVVLQTQLDQQVEAMRSEIARANLQDSYAAYMNTLGRRFFQPVSLLPGGAS